MYSLQHLKPTEPDIFGHTQTKGGKKNFKITISPELHVGALNSEGHSNFLVAVERQR